VKLHTSDNVVTFDFIDLKDLLARESLCGWVLSTLMVVRAVKHQSVMVVRAVKHQSVMVVRVVKHQSVMVVRAVKHQSVMVAVLTRSWKRSRVAKDWKTARTMMEGQQR
jgi:hypothetical protein